MRGIGQVRVIGAQREWDCGAFLIRLVDQLAGNFIHDLLSFEARMSNDPQNFNVEAVQVCTGEVSVRGMGVPEHSGWECINPDKSLPEAAFPGHRHYSWRKATMKR